MIYNISELVKLFPKKNHYTYSRIKNLLNGFHGKSSKDDIQSLRKALSDMHQKTDLDLKELEKKVKK